MSALRLELLAQGFLDGRVRDDRLFGSADRPVVEARPCQNVLRGLSHVGRSLDKDRHLSRADAQSGLARRGGPPRNAGCPEAAPGRTRPMPPVAGMTAVCLCFIKASVPSIVAEVRQPMASAGNPSLMAASRTTLTVSLMQRAAEGCGLSTMALRDLILIRHLKMAVEVGFMEGMM